MDINMAIKPKGLLEALIRIAAFLVVASIFLYPETANVYLKQGSRIVFVLLVILYMVSKHIKIDRKYFIWAFSFSFLCFLNCLFAEYKDPAVSNLIIVVQAVWIAFFLVVWLSESGSHKWVFHSVIMCSLIYCIRIIGYIGTINWGERKIGFILGTNVNSIGFRLAVACLFSIYLFYKNSLKRRYIYLLLSIVFVGFILVSGSRRALLLCIIAYVIFSLSQAKDFFKRMRSYLWIFGIITAVYIAINYIPSLYAVIGSRVNHSIASIFSSDAFLDNGRDEMISAGLRLFFERPLFGWGMNNFRYVSGIDHAYSHNNYVELLFAMGLPTFVVYYYIVALCFKARKVFKKRSLDRVLCVTLLTYCLVADMAAANYTSLLSHLFFAIPISMFLYKTRHEENYSSETFQNAD